MALLFLNEPKEAACFTTRGTESVLKWMADASSNTGILGIQGGPNEKLLYIGHGSKDVSKEVEKILCLDYDTLRILRSPDTSFPKNPQFPDPLWTLNDQWDANPARPILKLQEALTIYADGSLNQQKPTHFTDTVTITAPFHLTHSNTDFTCDTNRIAWDAPMLHLNASNCLEMTATNSVMLSTPLFHCDTNAVIHGNLRVTQHLQTTTLEVTEIHCKEQGYCPQLHTEHINTDALTVGSNALLVYPNRVIVGSPIELKQNIYLSPSAIFTTEGITIGPSGHIHSQGGLSLTAPDKKHTIHGTLDIYGPTRLKGDTVIENRCQMLRDTVVGQPHCPASLCVYGATHLSQPFYSHERAYFDKDIVSEGALKLLGGKSPADKMIEIPKGSLELQQGSLWIRGKTPTETVVSVVGNTMLGGTLSAQQTSLSSLKVAGPTRLTEMDCQTIIVGGNVTIGQHLTVENVFKTTPEALLLSSNVSLTVPMGNLTVAGDIACHSVAVGETMRIVKGLHIETGTPQEGTPLRVRNRRYGLYEPIAMKPRLFQFMKLPYGRGCAHFNIRLKGQCLTPFGNKTIDIELGGVTKQPTTKRVKVEGRLKTHDGYSADQALKIRFYQHSATMDYYGFIECHRRFAVGFEIQIECPPYRDVFEWKALDLIPSPKDYDPHLEIWWSPLDCPDEQRDTGEIVWMAKTGIGETQPLYALDVRAEARFQSKLYCPFARALAESVGVPVVVHGDQTYVAVGDVLEALIKKVVR